MSDIRLITQAIIALCYHEHPVDDCAACEFRQQAIVEHLTKETQRIINELGERA